MSLIRPAEPVAEPEALDEIAGAWAGRPQTDERGALDLHAELERIEKNLATYEATGTSGWAQGTYWKQAVADLATLVSVLHRADRVIRAQGRDLAELGSLRPEVLVFAHAMEAKLRANDHKPGWKDDDPDDLLTRLHEELDELTTLIDREVDYAQKDEVNSLLSEAADVGNFAMMISDVATRWHERRTTEANVLRGVCLNCTGEQFDGFICEECGRSQWIDNEDLWHSTWPDGHEEVLVGDDWVIPATEVPQ